MRYVPFTTSPHTNTAPRGTTIWRLTPKTDIPDAKPANSEIVLPKLVASSRVMRINVARSPYSSRIRSESPLPVTTPMRATISCTTIRATVIGISVHSSE